MVVVPAGLTLEEFLKLPEEKPALEYEAGVVTQKVSPKIRHGRLQSKLAQWFNVHAEPRRIEMALTETRATFGGRSRVPDVIVCRWERLPRDAAGNLADDLQEPPAIAIEIVSPGQSVNSLVRRCLWYIENGVPIALLVDPADQSVLDFRPGQPMRVARGADRIDFALVVPGLQLGVDELFGWLRDTPPAAGA